MKEACSWRTERGRSTDFPRRRGRSAAQARTTELGSNPQRRLGPKRPVLHE
jgi:hypothetical protein